MSETTVKDYYHSNMPRGEAIIGQTVWSGAAPVAVTIQPSADEADFVGCLELMVSDDFAMTATDVITLTINAYGNTQTLIVTGATAALDLAELLAWGDSETYETATIATVLHHKVVIKFKPPVYLRSSTSPAESVSLTYTPTGGGITAGRAIITTKYWTITDEDDSGL